MINVLKIEPKESRLLWTGKVKQRPEVESRKRVGERRKSREDICVTTNTSWKNMELGNVEGRRKRQLQGWEDSRLMSTLVILKKHINGRFVTVTWHTSCSLIDTVNMYCWNAQNIREQYYRKHQEVEVWIPAQTQGWTRAEAHGSMICVSSVGCFCTVVLMMLCTLSFVLWDKAVRHDPT